MSVSLTEHMEKLVYSSYCDENVRNDFLRRVRVGKLTRDENSEDHFCAGFFPFNPETRQVFLVHHKKSGLWIAPGGHVDFEELPDKTLQREIYEELGFMPDPQAIGNPFFLTVNELKKNALQLCCIHYELWYVLLTDGECFNVDKREFHETRWVSFERAREIVTDPCNLLALQVLEHKMFSAV